MFKKITVPFRRFAHVHVDLVGPLPPSHGYTYFLTCIDRSTCWPEVIHLVWISSAEYASAMFHEWISRFGVPTIITSDRGTQFTSSLWSAICSLLNIRQNLTTTFHFQSKGIIERFHRQLKKILYDLAWPPPTGLSTYLGFPQLRPQIVFQTRRFIQFSTGVIILLISNPVLFR